MAGWWFQPTRPHGARPKPATSIHSEGSFNPRARMGRDTVTDIFNVSHHVSTHAPAWGATDERWVLAQELCVSTHAPAWGATDGRCGLEWVVEVSTHAPAWGATGRTGSISSTLMFQPTRPHGARPHSVSSMPSAVSGFNPRARMGRDNPFHVPFRNGHGFNPRARMGRDFVALDFVPKQSLVSTHAPAWGATYRNRIR